MSTGVQMACYLELTLASAGKIQGDSTTTSLSRKDLIECWSFYHEVTAPRDASTGQAVGRRVHKPIRVVTPVGSASALLFQALTTNEGVTKAKFSFYNHDGKGKEREYYRVTIEDGTINYLSTRLPNTKAQDLAIHDEFHEVEFTFRKITVENLVAGKMAADDWQQLTT